MNLLQQNLDSLRTIIRQLIEENKELKSKLKSAGIPYDTADFFDLETSNNEKYDYDQVKQLARGVYVTIHTNSPDAYKYDNQCVVTQLIVRVRYITN